MARAGRSEGRATKGDRTRAFIIEQAAEAYNVHGYAGLSISEVLARTNLEKGGLYNHFKSKDELAYAAFDHLVARLRARIDAAMSAAGPGAAARLLAMAQVYHDIADAALTRGGCPILNTATEADDTHPGLRNRAREAMGRWHDLITTTIATGMSTGEFASTASPGDSATVIIAALEGGVLMSKLYHDASYVRSVATFLRGYVGSLLSASARGT